MDNLESEVQRHNLEISYINKTLNELVEYSKETTKQLQKIGDSIAKQEVILEKITNIEDRHNQSVKRLHSRVDEVEQEIGQEKDDVLKRIDKLESAVEKLKIDLINRPCRTHSVVENEIKHIKEGLATHQKIFWTAISTISVTVIGAIVSMVLKH